MIRVWRTVAKLRHGWREGPEPPWCAIAGEMLWEGSADRRFKAGSAIAEPQRDPTSRRRSSSPAGGADQI
jgi:hypothetical protein